MLVSAPLASFITFFRTTLINNYLNSQRFFLSHNCIQRIRFQENKGPKHTHLTIFWNFCMDDVMR